MNLIEAASQQEERMAYVPGSGVPTVKDIQKWIKAHQAKYGVSSAAPCCIAKVKRHHRVPSRNGTNTKPCSAKQITAIEDALKSFGTII